MSLWWPALAVALAPSKIGSMATLLAWLASWTLVRALQESETKQYIYVHIFSIYFYTYIYIYMYEYM